MPVVPTYEGSPWDEERVARDFSRDVLGALTAQGCTPLGLVTMCGSGVELVSTVSSTAGKEAFAVTTGKNPFAGSVTFNTLLGDGSVISTERMAQVVDPRSVAGVSAMISDSYRLELAANETSIDDLWARHRARIEEHRARGGAEPLVHDSLDLQLAYRRAVAAQRDKRYAFQMRIQRVAFYVALLPGVMLVVRAWGATGRTRLAGIGFTLLFAFVLAGWAHGRAVLWGPALYRRLYGGLRLDVRELLPKEPSARRP